MKCCTEVPVFKFCHKAIKHGLTELLWPFLSSLGALSTFKVLVRMAAITSNVETFFDLLTGCQESSGLVMQLAIDVILEVEHALITAHKLKLLEAFVVIEMLFHQLHHVEAIPELTGPGVFDQHLAASG